MLIEEAIEIMNNFIKDTPKMPYECLMNKEVEAVETLLNELEKQQAEIETKDNYLEQISQCLNNIAIDQIPIAIAELKFFIDLKDKQIDLMAKEIDKESNPDICKQMQGMECNNREILCTECIKQYFIKKASE